MRGEATVTRLPDGSAFGAMSLPLPKDHWLFAVEEDGFGPPPPMPLRMADGPARRATAARLTEALRYAVKAATWHGREADFDPDALVQNALVGLLGYWTPDGLSGDAWANPEVVPPLWGGLPEEGAR